jgi:hypothetical protein
MSKGILVIRWEEDAMDAVPTKLAPPRESPISTNYSIR